MRWRGGEMELRGGDETLLLPDGGGGREEGRGGEGGEDVREKRGRGDMFSLHWFDNGNLQLKVAIGLVDEEMREKRRK